MTDCLFCQIASGEIPATIVAETDTVVAFRDIAPQAPVHVLVIPRAHHRDIAALAGSSPATVADLVALAADVATAEGLAADGYRLVFNTGEHGGQTVHHVHAHLMGGRHMGWPPG